MSAATLKLYAPLSGRVLPITSVPDPVFSQKLVGDGVAIDPTTQVLVAPCAGEVVQLHSAHHACTIQSETGAQILLHIGLDTVQLKGEGFRPKVKVGARVSAGQPLIEFNADLIARKAKSLITIMVVTGDTEVRALNLTSAQAGKDFLLELPGELMGGAPSADAEDAGGEAMSEPIKIELPTGLHARPAALLVNLAKSFQSKIEIHKGDTKANAKSVVGIMGLEVGNSDSVRFKATGADAKKAVDALSDFLENLEEKADNHAPIKPVTKASFKTPSTDKNVLLGVGVSPGLAIGRVQQVRSKNFNISEKARGTPAQEKVKLNQALEQSVRELHDLLAQVKNKTDASRAAIFNAHQELLEDPDILELAMELMDQGKSAPFAWNEAINTHAERLAHLNNELMANRANDLRDVGKRVLRALLGEGETVLAAQTSDTILIAENLTPSETVQLDREKVFAFCTTTGGATSHVAILARSLGLPAIAGMDPRVLDVEDGTEIILDGDKGEIRLNPTAEQKALIQQKQGENLRKRKEALALAHNAATTKDGAQIEVAANIGSVADAEKAMEMGADGVGLLRSEFLFLERATAPSEDEQFNIYQQIADTLGPRTLVIRTLDVGGDKPLQYLPIPQEENPFLGIRGIRVGLLHQQILRDQLRAILRVKTDAKIHIMFPMIATVEEFRASKAILEEERAKLGVPPVKVGIMIEVPSAALIADAFAREVDFFSIGTNDLTQYTLAMDRGHKDLAKQADALHPSVLKLIELTCAAAKRHGKWVGVCGGLAGDLRAVAILIGLGVEELSVSIPSIPLVKSQVRLTTNKGAKEAGQRAVHAASAKEVRELTQDETDPDNDYMKSSEA